MPQMNPKQARVIDPIVTAVARGYRSNKAAIATVLFPIVSVTQRAGTIIVFGPDDFKLINTTRAPGTNTRRVQFGHASGNFSLVDHRLEAVTPWEIQEESKAVPGIDLVAGNVRKVQNLMALERERQAASLARNPANYAADNKVNVAGADQWDNAASDPIQQVNAKKEVIRSMTGERPNVLAVAPKVLTALRNHPAILDRLSTSTDRSPATLEQLQKLFEVESIVEGAAVYHDGAKFADLWGLDAVLAFTTPASLADQGSPNFGYTYQLGEGIVAEEGYDDRNSNSWIVPVSDAYQAVLAGATAGCLFQNAVSGA